MCMQEHSCKFDCAAVLRAGLRPVYFHGLYVFSSLYRPHEHLSVSVWFTLVCKVIVGTGHIYLLFFM